jgi:hypothetical protein
MNRIGSLLVLHNLRPNVVIGGRDWASWWEHHREEVPPVLRAELERESARLSLVKQQVKALEAERRLEVETGKQPVVAHLTQLAGHRSQDSLGAGQGALRLAALRQPARTGWLAGPGAYAL